MIAKDIFSLWGMEYEKIDMTETSLVISKIDQALAHQRAKKMNKPVVVWIEVPSNPLTKVADMEAISSYCRSFPPHEIILVADSTWCSPFLLSPLKQFPFDIVFHSITKYITGHSDVLGGIATVSNHFATHHAERFKTLQTVQQICGGVCGPWEAWMAMRGLRTLPVRMKQHCHSAMELARRLESHPCVERVYYPGLASHPQHEVATKLMKTGFYGGMMSILIKPKELGDGQEEALQVSSTPFCPSPSSDLMEMGFRLSKL
jgi:cystathionine beta-lyase/cystathionine gamma-synthase